MLSEKATQIPSDQYQNLVKWSLNEGPIPLNLLRKPINNLMRQCYILITIGS